MFPNILGHFNYYYHEILVYHPAIAASQWDIILYMDRGMTFSPTVRVFLFFYCPELHMNGTGVPLEVH